MDVDLNKGQLWIVTLPTREITASEVINVYHIPSDKILRVERSFVWNSSANGLVYYPRFTEANGSIVYFLGATIAASLMLNTEHNVIIPSNSDLEILFDATAYPVNYTIYLQGLLYQTE